MTTENTTQEEFDPFEAAMKKREKEKKEAEDKKNGKGNFDGYEVLNWQGTDLGTDTALRLIGRPYDFRSAPHDAKVLHFSEILKDTKDGYVKINWKPKTDPTTGLETLQLDENWILMELVNKIKEGKWVRYAEPIITEDGKEKKGEFQHFHKDSVSFKRIENNQAPKDKFAKRFNAEPRIVMNCITRMSDVCKTNKHTVLLSTDHNFWKNDDQGLPIYFTKPGIPLEVYDKFISEVLNFRKDWTKLDIIIRKEKVMKGNKTNYTYTVRDAKEDKIDPQTRLLLNADPLTEAEIAYGKYNLDKYFATTKYHKLVKNLSGLFKTADGEFGTHFFEKLTELARLEKEEYEKNTQQSQTTQHRVVKPEENVATNVPTINESVETGESIEDQCKKHFAHWDELTDLDKTFTVAGIEKFVPYQNGIIPVYKKSVETIPCECNDKKYPGTDKQPETVQECSHCMVCGKSFQIK